MYCDVLQSDYGHLSDDDHVSDVDCLSDGNRQTNGRTVWYRDKESMIHNSPKIFRLFEKLYKTIYLYCS